MRELKICAAYFEIQNESETERCCGFLSSSNGLLAGYMSLCESVQRRLQESFIFKFSK